MRLHAFIRRTIFPNNCSRPLMKMSKSIELVHFLFLWRPLTEHAQLFVCFSSQDCESGNHIFMLRDGEMVCCCQCGAATRGRGNPVTILSWQACWYPWQFSFSVMTHCECRWGSVSRIWLCACWLRTHASTRTHPRAWQWGRGGEVVIDCLVLAIAKRIWLHEC